MALTFDLQARAFVADLVTVTPEWWNHRGLKSGFWRLYYHREDGAGVKCNGRHYRFKGGRAYLIPAGVLLDLVCTAHLSHLYIHFDVLGLSLSAMANTFNRPMEVPNPDSIIPMLERIRKLLEGGDSAVRELRLGCQALSAVYQALFNILDALPEKEVLMLGGPGLEMEDILPAIRKVDEGVDYRHTVESLAAYCGLSKDRFAKRFKTATGRSPMSYVQERRVQVAEQKLLFTNRTIEQIAGETGFGTREYFTRIFTRHTGCSPAAYRKRKHV